MDGPAAPGTGASVRWWRLRPWTDNELMRSADRLESAIVTIAVVLSGVWLIVAVLIGADTRARLDREAAAAAADQRQVEAVLLADAPAKTSASSPWGPTPYGADAVTVPASWTRAGQQFTGPVPAPPDARAGHTVVVTVDARGAVVPPRTAADHTVVAVFAGLGIWAAGAGVAVGAACVAHSALTRYRLRQWARDWDRFDAPWHATDDPVSSSIRSRSPFSPVRWDAAADGAGLEHVDQVAFGARRPGSALPDGAVPERQHGLHCPPGVAVVAGRFEGGDGGVVQERGAGLGVDELEFLLDPGGRDVGRVVEQGRPADRA